MVCITKGRFKTIYFSISLMLMVNEGYVYGQNTENEQPEQTAKKLEDTVFADMLRIVDHKFDTLTTRITALERAVSGLQFFSIRQFRQVSSSIQSSEKDLENLSKQVGKLEVESRGFKIAMSLLGRNMNDLKSDTSAVLGELESSVVYINDHIDKQTTSIKAAVEDLGEKIVSETASMFTQQAIELERASLTREEPFNCTVDFSSISDHVDLRFAEFKHETHENFVNLINAEKLAMDNGEIENTPQNTQHKNQDRKIQIQKKEVMPISESLALSRNKPVELNADFQGTKKLNFKELNRDYHAEKYYSEQDDKIMQVLLNMTESVQQAVSYFRLTGRVLEEITSNTETLVNQQNTFKNDIELLKLGIVTPKGYRNQRSFEVNNAIPDIVKEADDPVASSFYPQNKANPSCTISVDVLNNIGAIIKNGSHLLEVLTDLAQIGSVSLEKTTESLQQEAKRAEDTTTALASILKTASENKAKEENYLVNITEKNFKLTEAIASNTGWMPIVFRNIQHLENMTNRTLLLTARNNGILQRMDRFSEGQQSKAATLTPVSWTGSTLLNKIAKIPESSKESENNVQAFSMDRDSLKTIYSTSLQLNRIMPALTKLLSEPDPLITLVGGGRLDQGRIEIYNNGRWGTICHDDISHQEADTICKHLGFHGGISAGAGHFGAGSGISWVVNASCLATSKCDVVQHRDDAPSCSHENDAAVICDHMLRIVPSLNVSLDKVGRLEIHHRGLWLPVCGERWSGYSARVACQQMGFKDGRETDVGSWPHGANTTWLSRVSCSGQEQRLDSCSNNGWVDECRNLQPAGVRCF